MFKRISSLRLFITALLALVLTVAPLNSFAASNMTVSMKMENCHDTMKVAKEEGQQTKIPNCCKLHFSALALPFEEPLIHIRSFEKVSVLTVVKQLTSNINFYEIEPPRTTSAL
jgi:hypothetical protein